MKDAFRAHGLPMVEHLLVRRHEWRRDPGAVERLVASQLGFPCFVKPANLGSSVGVSRVKAADDLAAAIELAARHHRLGILVERSVQGREVEVAVLGNDAPIASVPGEVCYAGEWYDYETKYGTGQTTLGARGASAGDDGPGAGARREGLSGNRRRRDGARGLLRRARRARARERDQYHPGLHRDQRVSAPVGGLGVPYPELISRLIALALER